MNGTGSLGVAEDVRAKLEYQSSRRSGESTSDYLILQACYNEQVRIHTPHVIDSNGWLKSWFCAHTATSGIP